MSKRTHRMPPPLATQEQHDAIWRFLGRRPFSSYAMDAIMEKIARDKAEAKATRPKEGPRRG